MKNFKLFISLLAGAGAYCYLMWYQSLGLNTVIFSVLLITAIFGYKKELRKNRTIQWLALAFFLSTIGVAINGIIYSKVIYYFTLLVFLSFVQIPQLRSLPFAACSFVINIFAGIKCNWLMTTDMLKSCFHKKKSSGSSRNLYVYIARGVIVFIMVSVFFIIFSSSNPQFRKLCENLIEPLLNFLQYIFEHVAFWDIFHYGFIFYFLSLFIFRFKSNFASQQDASCSNDMVRKRIRIFDNFLSVGLKDEYKTALLSISLINILLLGVNMADLFSVWLGIVPDSANELSDFVHTGTYALIFSTLLSIGILLFFFRQNLNLYTGNKKLKIIAYTWILQNAFLLASVAIRNMHYIGQCGLTYKRIGVFIFLVITAVALLFLYSKISNRRSFYYYFRTCGWGLFCTILITGWINWDMLIAYYNTNKKDVETDYHYLRYGLSEQALMYLPENELSDWQQKMDNYITEVNNREWQSFSWCDLQAARKLEEIRKKLPSIKAVDIPGASEEGISIEVEETPKTSQE